MLFFCPRREKVPNPPTPSSVAELKTALQELADFCAGSPIPILITGGLSIALQLGGVYRNHHDVDLAIFEEHLPAFLQHIDSKGFRLFRSVASGHLSAACDLYFMKKASLEEILRTGIRHLRLAPKNRRIVLHTHRITDYFDLFVYSVQGDRVYLFQEGISIPKEEFFPIFRYDLSGKTLYTPNTRFLRRLKEKKDSPTNRMDMNALSNGFNHTNGIVRKFEVQAGEKQILYESLMV